MAEKLKIDSGTTKIGNKIIDIHQKNEYTRVNDYKEGMCFGCFDNKVAVSANVVDICGDCAGKKGREAILVPIKEVYYGMCYFCGKYKFHMEKINARFCQKCYRKIANVMKEYNKKGGMFNADPFWVNMRKKHGQDWQIIMSNGLGNKR